MDSILDAAIVNQFIGLLQSRLGIAIKNHQYSELQKTILNTAAQFNIKPVDLLKKMSVCQENDPIFESIIIGVTVGESYFFRDTDQFEFLEHFLIPDIISRKLQLPFSTLRIWSAGCSSGEEIYSIAMLLNECSFYKEKIKVQLIGSDINCDALRRAKEGAYTEWSFRSTPEHYRKKYFTQKENRYYLNETIKNSVQFNYVNINNFTYPSIINGIFALDVILCRNVFIYFDIDRIKRIMKQFSASLCADGCLILGASDPAIFSSNDLERCQYQSTYYFKKAAVTLSAEFNHLKEIPTHASTIKQNLVTEILTAKKTQAPSLINPDFEVHLNQLMNENKFENVLYYINQNNINKLTYEIELIRIRCLANLGFIQLAESHCISLLKTHTLSSEIYYLLGLCQSELKQLDAAEASFRKALFLDQHYIAAQIQLGNLLLRQHNKTEGLRLLKRCLDVLNNLSEDHKVKDYPHMDAGKLQQLLKNELSLYQEVEELNDKT